MQIICISRGSQSQGEEFAKSLAAKLDYKCLSREQLLEEATKRRIPVGKLETAIIKPHIFNDKLSLEMEHYKALATSILCEQALSGNIIYHGRSGHLLLPGINHILKLRVVSEMEYRIKNVMEKMKLSREKAKLYIEQIDDDRKKWVKTFYNTDWDVFTMYDLILNLSYMSVNNAASAVCSMAQLPEFQATPFSIKSLKDIYLESKAHLLLFSDKRTNSFHLRIKANSGFLNITYPVHLAEKIGIIDEILRKLEDVKEIVYTKAQTNILWIQEKYDVNDNSYRDVISVANNWDAAVELLKIIPDDEKDSVPVVEENPEMTPDTWRETGIIADGEDVSTETSKDMLKVYEKLIIDGRAGGKRTITGSKKTLINSIDKSANYKLIIFDNIFLSKSEAARKRTLREWSNAISDLILTPIVTVDELENKYRFRPKNLVQLIVSSLITILITFLVFNFSPQINEFLSGTESGMRIVATICVLVFVPLFAFVYSIVTSLLLKLIKFE